MPIENIVFSETCSQHTAQHKAQLIRIPITTRSLHEGMA
jgi:hypothetical protein